MKRKNRLQRRLANRTIQWQQTRAENAVLCQQLEQAMRNQLALQLMQSQLQAAVKALTRANKTYHTAFERIVGIVGRECIAAGVPINQALPGHLHHSGMCYAPYRHLRGFPSPDQITYQQGVHLMHLLRAYPVVVDALVMQVHFRAALGNHWAQSVYAISDVALMRMDAETLAELLATELAGLLVAQIKQATFKGDFGTQNLGTQSGTHENRCVPRN